MVKDDIGDDVFMEFCWILDFKRIDDCCSWLKMELASASNKFNYFSYVVLFS